MNDVFVAWKDVHTEDAEKYPGGPSWQIVQLIDALVHEKARADRLAAMLKGMAHSSRYVDHVLAQAEAEGLLNREVSETP